MADQRAGREHPDTAAAFEPDQAHPRPSLPRRSAAAGGSMFKLDLNNPIYINEDLAVPRARAAA